ncbi:hypothetical protein HKCCE2091_08130 [Rhodobacterales bacterium HKCCE2091]|nr:hypothetical protein [Rhodobacterales bacterium HKCCE2091]
MTVLGAAEAQGIRVDGTPRAMPADNDFAGYFGSGPSVLLSGASLTLTAPAQVTFTEFGAESGNDNAFSVAGIGTLAEQRDFGPRLRSELSGLFPPGPLDPYLAFFGESGLRIAAGSPGFGAVVPGDAAGLHARVFLVLDDAGGDDGDFDDYIIRVDVTPAP